MNEKDLIEIIKILRKESKNWDVPVVSLVSETHKDPFSVLISTVISLRTKDEVTLKSFKRLYSKAKTPKEMLKLKESEIEKLIYPAGFYKIKAKNIKKICEILISEYKGKVPNSMEKLLELPNVGRKTANLVISVGFDGDGVCIDTHNHRILNRLGFLKTKNPEETEYEVRKKLDKEYWRELNFLLVGYGQYICRPISPYCSKCEIKKKCKRRGVEVSR
ncbi:MAG: endonuclease III [Nanoarchaeota archaeon]|nr:endonuclease III [Nanoarchaeota archaeon]